MQCKNLKYRTKKSRRFLYCNLLKKEITFDNAKTVQIRNIKRYIAQQIVKIVYFRRKSLLKLTKKNSKITKLERNRKSVFTDDLTKCILCNRPKEELHEIFAGRNRLNSMRYNFVLPLYYNCHSINQNNSQFNEFWHRKAQLYKCQSIF